MGPRQDHRRRPRAAARTGLQRLSAVYDRIGAGYADLRRPDRRIAAAIESVLDGSVVNVGAGAGSYEPATTVAAVEPSREMLRQRPVAAAPAVQAVAEALPFADGSFGTALAVLTTHHWTRPLEGLAELCRVVREAWPTAAVVPVPVPWDCTDGFFAAYWRRPEAYLVPAVRSAISAFALLDPARVEPAVARLEHDLASGEWDRRHGALRGLDALDCGYRLVVHDG